MSINVRNTALLSRPSHCQTTFLYARDYKNAFRSF